MDKRLRSLSKPELPSVTATERCFMREQDLATTMNRREMLKFSAVAALIGTKASGRKHARKNNHF
jgi:hypothetical protein